MSGVNVIVDGSYGIYVPQRFVKAYSPDEWNIALDDLRVLIAGPDHEHYWETWDDVLSKAQFTDSQGNVWRLTQDGDLFAYCEQLMTRDEREALGFDTSEQ